MLDGIVHNLVILICAGYCCNVDPSFRKESRMSSSSSSLLSQSDAKSNGMCHRLVAGSSCIRAWKV